MTDSSGIPIRQEGESAVEYAKRRSAYFGTPVPDRPPEKGASKLSEQPFQEWDADLIPEEEYTGSPFDGERQEIDAVLGNITVLDVYLRLIGKMVPNSAGKTKNIMISCPIPGHVDAHPSADINLEPGDGGVWHCHRCQEGGDKYDLAAIAFHYDRPGYKDGINFPNLRRELAAAFGWTVVVQGKDEWLQKAESLAPQVLHSVTEDEPELQPEYEYENPDTPSFDWRTLGLNPESFLHQWMVASAAQDQPEEFYLFSGLVALGLAAKNNAQMRDQTPVRANTMICLVGGTGTGKTRSIFNLRRLLYDALPFDSDTGGGVRWIHSPGSGEDLVNQFVLPNKDPTTQVTTFHPVTGLMYEDEFEGLMARVNKPNSTMRSFMMRFFDSHDYVSKSSQTHGASIAKGHFFQGLTTTQPKRLGSLMTTGDATSGFLNRWLFAFGTPKDRPVMSEIEMDITGPSKTLVSVRGWASQLGDTRISLTADPEAFQVWSDLVLGELRKLEALDNLLIARIELQCKKLLLLFAVNDMSTVVTKRHLDSLLAIFPYIKKCYGVVEENVGVTQLQNCIDAMDQYFKGHPDDDIPMRTLAKNSGARKFDTATRAKAIETMVKVGYIVEAPKPKGTQTIKWRLVVDSGVTLASVTQIS